MKSNGLFRFDLSEVRLIAERSEHSGEVMPQTHRRDCALPLQGPRFKGGKMLHNVARREQHFPRSKKGSESDS